MCDFYDFGLTKNVFWLVAQLPRRLEDCLKFFLSAGAPFEKISNSVDFSL